MECETNVLIAGVDTLILNAKQVDTQGKPFRQQTLPDHLKAHFAVLQEQAKANMHPAVTPWKQAETTLLMWPHGAPGWTWLLKNGLIDVMCGPLLNNSALARVRFSSEYLWRAGVKQAVCEVEAWLKTFFGGAFFLQAAEVHLCADIARMDIPKDYEQVFVTRAKVQRPIKETFLDRPTYRYGKLETVQFSGRGSPMSATIYNKPREIQMQSPDKVWFYDLWQRQGWCEGMPVWRVECRYKRVCLHEMDIEEVCDLIAKIPALWAYGVGHVGEHDGWLRMVTPDEQDNNRWRWETQAQWQTIQAAFSQWRGYEEMEDVQRERKREVNLDRAEAAIAGYTATYAAWLENELSDTDDVSVVMTRLYEKITERWERKGTDFHYLRRQKQFDYHLS